MFSSIFQNESINSVGQFFIMIAVALISGLLFSWILSFKVRSTKRFFIVNSILPLVVGAILSFVNGNLGLSVAIGGAFALVRFRSAPGSADEIASIFITMAGGVAFGMGYLAYGAILLVGLGLIYIILSSLNLFEHKIFKEEKMLKITIPESLDYQNVFDSVFNSYLKDVENMGVKTTAMGSMYKLSYRIKMKDDKDEKEMIDDLRILNGNLEIQITPYVEANNIL